MGIDVLILNTAVMDFRGPDFAFVDDLVGAGGLAKCRNEDMSPYTQAELQRWVDRGCATAGGPGNTAPLIARAGLRVAVGCYLGRGDRGGLDVQGRAFHDILTANGVDMSEAVAHPSLPTGTTFIHEAGNGERGGIGYYPNANNDFDFERFKGGVERLRPRIVYYMYSGLSDRGDANGGRDLAAFMAWCRARGAITIADSHTLCADPAALIASGAPVAEYRLLEPLLPELDLFFTSADEGRMIANTLAGPRNWRTLGDDETCRAVLDVLAARRFWTGPGRTRLSGVTVRDGAWHLYGLPDGRRAGPTRATSRFMCGEVVDLVGAGDSFRAGLIGYVARNAAAFADGTLNVDEAVQMGNLFASLYIKAPLRDRYVHIRPYEKMLAAVRGDRTYASLDAMLKEIE